MHPSFRESYNSFYSDELFARQTRDLLDEIGASPGFRLAETPVFLTEGLADSLTAAAREIVLQLQRPGLKERMMEAIPARWRAPGMDALPSVAQVDLAVVRDVEGGLAPRLIELQGFPSLSAFEVFQARAWNRALQSIPGLPQGGWTPFFSGLDEEGYRSLLRRTILGDEDPETVVLVDLRPDTQKTFVDFVATKKLLGIDTVCASDLAKDGCRLVRRSAGRTIPVRRVYNRIVFDELIRSSLPLGFDFRDELDVTWVPHPNWYWTWSKYSLPFLDHPAVPSATFLSELDGIPADLTERYVLKPLFSFAGGGVNVEPTPADLARVPETERGAWCLQEKIHYEPCIRAADGGGVKVEIRMMFYRPEGSSELTLGLNLCRLSRGKMLGVDFNKDFTWVGSSVALRPAGA